jgi:soluble lytic murein transglycosylase-like protein
MGISKSAVEDVNRIYNFSFTYDDMFEPKKNITTGIYYIRYINTYFLQEIPTEVKIIYIGLAYNAGIGFAKEFFNETSMYNALKIIPQETQYYVWKIAYLYPVWKAFLSK